MRSTVRPNRTANAPAAQAFARTTGQSRDAVPAFMGQGRTSGVVELVLLELGSPVSAGIEALVRFRQARPGTPVVVVSAFDDAESVRAAFDAGATGYIRKGATPLVVATVLRLLAAGQRHGSRNLGRRTRTPRARWSPRKPVSDGSGSHLTERQVQVLQLAAKGFANKDIARELELAENTIKVHLRAAYATLGVCSRTQALLAASRHGVKF